MSSFQDLDETRSQKLWGRSPEDFRAVGVVLQDRESLFYATCLKVINIVNEINPILENTTFSVLSVILINLMVQMKNSKKKFKIEKIKNTFNAEIW